MLCGCGSGLFSCISTLKGMFLAFKDRFLKFLLDFLRRSGTPEFERRRSDCECCRLRLSLLFLKRIDSEYIYVIMKNG